MDPLRLRFLLTLALANAQLSDACAITLAAQAIHQLTVRWPLAGCAVNDEIQGVRIIAVGRQ